PFGHLVVVKACLDLILDLFERAFARGSYADNVEIEIAAVRQLECLSIDANITRKSCVDDVGRLRQSGNRLSVGPASGPVNRLDVDDRKTKFLGNLGQSRTSRPLIFDLVA